MSEVNNYAIKLIKLAKHAGEISRDEANYIISYLSGGENVF